MGKAIALATPVFFLLIALELLVARARGMSGVYRLNDAINSLSLGVMSQVVGLFVRVLNYGVYALVFEHVALGTWPHEWWAWALAIVFYDFCYYWNHRLGHESAVFWASHVVHHQSQRYNLSTALRQTSSGAFRTLDLLPADGGRGRAARDVRGGGDSRPALPVLDPHRSHRQARLVRPLVRVA